MPFTLAYGSFPPNTRVFVVPLSTLEVDETLPVAGRVIAEGLANEWGSVTFADLFSAGEGPSDGMSMSLLRCIACAGPFGPRIVIYPRRTQLIESGTYPGVPWSWTVPWPEPDPDAHVVAQATVPAPDPSAWEPRVTHSPHTMISPPENPQAEGRRWVAPARVPTTESSAEVWRRHREPAP